MPSLTVKLLLFQKLREPGLTESQEDLQAVFDKKLTTYDRSPPLKHSSCLDESFLECPRCKVPYPTSQHRELLAHLDFCTAWAPTGLAIFASYMLPICLEKDLLKLFSFSCINDKMIIQFHKNSITIIFWPQYFTSCFSKQPLHFLVANRNIFRIRNILNSKLLTFFFLLHY